MKRFLDSSKSSLLSSSRERFLIPVETPQTAPSLGEGGEVVRKETMGLRPKEEITEESSSSSSLTLHSVWVDGYGKKATGGLENAKGCRVCALPESGACEFFKSRGEDMMKIDDRVCVTMALEAVLLALVVMVCS